MSYQISRIYFFILLLLALSAAGSAAGQDDAPLTLTDQPLKTRISPELLAIAEGSTNGISTAADRPSHIIFDGSRVGLRIQAADVDTLLPHLKALGFEVFGSEPHAHFIEGTLPPDRVADLEILVQYGFLGAIPLYQPITGGGSTTSQADIVHEAGRVRGTLPGGTDGSGVTIGVLSDSYNANGGAAAGIASGDLPSTVTIIEDAASGTDEGRAMIELAYDLAPGAGFAFATALGGESNFAGNIRDLAGSGTGPVQGTADVIVDDLIYLTEPFFQDGLVAQAINDVVNNDGVAYFSAAGNQGTEAYESTAFVPTLDGGTGLIFHDFNTSGAVDIAQRVVLGSGETIRLVLQWDDPFYKLGGVDTDLDIYLFNDTGTQVAASTLPNKTIQLPLEILTFANTGATAEFDIAIAIEPGDPAPGRIKYINYGDEMTVTEYDTNSPTINSHAAAENAMAVGAAFYANQLEPETFSSRGPSTILFAPDGTTLGAPEIRSKPNFTAVDGTNTTFFGSDIEGDGFPNFFGTSAASPHAAGVGALIKAANPTLTPQEIYDLLADTATDITSTGVGNDNTTGAGLINAYDAIFGIQSVAPQSSFTETFEGSVLGPQWETRSNGPGVIRLTGEHGPQEGSQHLVLDRFPISSLESPILFGLNELILHLDLSASTQVSMAFAVREFFDEDHPMPVTFTGSHNSDGVALSVDGGVNWLRLISLTGTNADDAYQTHTIDLTQVASNNALTLGSDVRIKFQQYDNFPLAPTPTPGNSDGLVFDNIKVTTNLPEIDAAVDGSPLLINDILSLPHVQVNNTLTKSVTITNTGKSDPLFIGTISVSPPYSVASGPGSPTLGPGDSTTFEVVFSPVQVGLATSTVSFSTNDGDENPFVFTISGYGGIPVYLPVIAKP